MDFERICEVARAAHRMGCTGPLSKGESLTAALVLNRGDWLAEHGYTIAQALDRIDDSTVPFLGEAERLLRMEGLFNG